MVGIIPRREPEGVAVFRMTPDDMAFLREALPIQRHIELVRSRSLALASDSLRVLTAAYDDGKLSEPGYLAMVCAIADILSPDGADQ
jgi:hypothetical protein